MKRFKPTKIYQSNDNKITNNLDGFNYNVIIANIYEIYNFVNKEIDKNIDSKSINDCYKKILFCLLLQFHISHQNVWKK